MKPYLSIITRHLPSRPSMLKRCEASLHAQTCQDFEHLVFTDEEGRGMEEAQKWLIDLVPRASGEYVLVLDDDDYMSNGDGVKLLKEASVSNPMGIIVPGYYGSSGILPKYPERFMEEMFAIGQVGVFSYVLRSDVYKRSVHVYASGKYEGDWLCLSDVWRQAKEEQSLDNFEFLHEVICSVQRISSQGRPE